MWVSSSNLEKERRDKNEEKNFYYKSPSIHCYHFITPYLIGNSNKNMTLFHLWLSVKPNFIRGDIHLQNRMFLFFILCKFPWHIHNIIFLVFCQNAISTYLIYNYSFLHEFLDTKLISSLTSQILPLFSK